MSQIGEKIRHIRDSKGLSLGQVAMKSGLDRTYISRIESERIGNPSHNTLLKIAKGLGIPASGLFIKEEKDLQIKGYHIAEEKPAPYGAEHPARIEKEYVRKLLDIFRGSNDRAIVGIKINIDIFHHLRHMKQL